MGAVLSTVAGNPCSVLSPVPLATLLYCADVRLTLREWLDALIGRDVLSEKPAEAAVAGSLSSLPQARRRIGTSSEALRHGASGEGASARQRVGTSSEAVRRGPRANRRIGRGLVVVSWL